MNQPPPSDASVRIDGFEGFRRIGAGGFSSVYSAQQASMGREVAIKVLHADFSSESDRRTFERECQALGLLSRHPNIVKVYSEAFTIEGRPCIVMELYHGNYRERLDTLGPLPIADLLSLGVKVAGALQAAHDRGILHRDLKPHNIFMSDYGEPVLGDFGISTIDDERSISAATGLSVAYAAPEVLEDATAIAASDIYSLAATLYHLAEGAAPFASPQLRTTVKRILTEDAPAMQSSGASGALNDVIMRALAKDPGDRYESAEAFGEALRDVQAALGFDRTDMPLRRGAGAPPPPRPADRSAPTTGPPESTIARSRTKPPVPSSQPLPATRSASPAASSAAVPPRPATTGATSAGAPSPVESTIRRTREVKEVVAEPSEVEAGPSATRRAIAVGLGVVAVGGAAFAAFVIGGGDDPETVSTTTAVTVEVNEPIVLTFLESPTAVEVVADEDGNAVVAFDRVDDAVEYFARSVFPSAQVDLEASGTGIVIETGVAVADADCWAVTAVSASGRQSEPSDATCVE